MNTPTLNIIEAGLARCVTEPRGAHGLEGYVLGQPYRFERCQDEKGRFRQLFRAGRSPGSHEGDKMTATLKRPALLLLALALLAGCKRERAGEDHPPLGADLRRPSPTPTEQEAPKAGYVDAGDEGLTLIAWEKTDRRIEDEQQSPTPEPTPRLSYDERKTNRRIKGRMLLLISRDGRLDGRRFSFDGIFEYEETSIIGWRSDDYFRLTFRDQPPRLVEGRKVRGLINKDDTLTLLWPGREGPKEQKFRPTSGEVAGRVLALERVEEMSRAFSDTRSHLAAVVKRLSVAIGELPGEDFYAKAFRPCGEALEQMGTAYVEMVNESRTPPINYRAVRSKFGVVKRGLDSFRRLSVVCAGGFRSADAKIRATREALFRLESAFARTRKAEAAGGKSESIFLDVQRDAERRVLTTNEAVSIIIEVARWEISKAAGVRDDAKSRAEADDNWAAERYEQAKRCIHELRNGLLGCI